MTILAPVTQITQAFIDELNANFVALDAVCDLAIQQNAFGDVTIPRDLIVTRAMGIGDAALSGIHLKGVGAATATISTSTVRGATLSLQDSGALANDGGQIIFGAAQGFFAGIKGLIQNGSNNTTGFLSFQTRAVDTDVALTERLQLHLTGITVTGTVLAAGAAALGAINAGTDVGSTDTYVATISPAPAAYINQAIYVFKANTVNTGTASINFNGLGAKTIVKALNTVLANADILAGMMCFMIYDAPNNNMILMNPRVL